MNELAQWNAAVRAWRLTRRKRPLGIDYVYPIVDLPLSLTVQGSGPITGYPPAFATLDRIAGGA